MTKLAFQKGTILAALTWKTMVLILKGGGEYIWIGLVEVIWKVYVLIMNNKLHYNINLNDILYGFRQGRGVATAIMEKNLA